MSLEDPLDLLHRYMPLEIVYHRQKQGSWW